MAASRSGDGLGLWTAGEGEGDELGTLDEEVLVPVWASIRPVRANGITVMETSFQSIDFLGTNKSS
jgi:hypothetical protein